MRRIWLAFLLVFKCIFWNSKFLFKKRWTTFFQGVFLWTTSGPSLDHVSGVEIPPTQNFGPRFLKTLFLKKLRFSKLLSNPSCFSLPFLRKKYHSHLVHIGLPRARFFKIQECAQIFPENCDPFWQGCWSGNSVRISAPLKTPRFQHCLAKKQRFCSPDFHACSLLPDHRRSLQHWNRGRGCEKRPFCSIRTEKKRCY